MAPGGPFAYCVLRPRPVLVWDPGCRALGPAVPAAGALGALAGSVLWARPASLPLRPGRLWQGSAGACVSMCRQLAGSRGRGRASGYVAVLLIMLRCWPVRCDDALRAPVMLSASM